MAIATQIRRDMTYRPLQQTGRLGGGCVRTEPKAIKRKTHYGLALGSSLGQRRSVDKQFHKLHDT